MNIPRQLFTRKPVFCPPAVFRWDRLPVGWLVILLLFPCFAHAAQVNLLNTTSITATGSGATGTPSISSFTIPAGKNRTLFIFAAFERDHCDQPGDICGPTNTTGAGLGDNYAGPIATGGSQITARVTGSGGTIDRKNASGGAPVGDLPLGGLYAQIGGMTAYSLESYPVTLKETELETLLGGAASGAVSITLPDVFAPKNTGDDAILMAFVFSNTDQTASGVVRSAIPYRIVAGAGMAGDYTLTASSFDAGQAPNDANDGLLVVGLSSLGLPDSYGGFQTMSGYSVLQSVLTNNAAGRYDNEEPTWVTTEPDGFSASAQFRNGIASTFSMTSAGAASLKMLAAMAPAFTLSSDNADTSDAPASYGSPTHAISGIRLGASVDADADILASYTATGDDTSGSDDEDGVTLPASLNLGQSYSIPVSIQSAAGYLNAWFDWNRDGDFLDAGEQVATNQPVSTGTSNLSITVPVTAEPRNTFARFRVCSSSGACQTPSGVAASGEVEDYLVSIAPKPVVPIPSTTCGNLLSGEFGGTFGTLASGIRDLQKPAMGGYIYTATSGAGTLYSSEYTVVSRVSSPGIHPAPNIWDGLYGADTGSADDAYLAVNGSALKGVFFAQTVPLSGGETFQISVFAINAVFGVDAANDPDLGIRLVRESDGLVVATTSTGPIMESYKNPGETFQGPGDWTQAVSNVTVPTTDNYRLEVFNFSVALSGNDFAIDRISIAPLSQSGCPQDFSDAPTTTLGGASHALVPDFYLGAGVTTDTADYNSAAADGDVDDGVLSFPVLTTGAVSYSVNATVTNITGTAATLHGWIDMNRNGTFDVGEHASVAVANGVQGGTVTLTWPSLPGLSAGGTFMRLRLTTENLSDNPGTVIVDERANVFAYDGEVEDYALVVVPAFPASYPTDAPMETCPIDPGSNFPAVEQAGWTHSNLSAPLSADVSGPELSAAQPLRPGPGIVYHINATSAWVQQAGESGLNAAYLAGDYVEYEFTTNALITGNRFLSKLRYGITATTTRAPYHISALISKDPDFANAKLIVDNHEVTAPTAYTQTRVLSINPVYLEPSTTYYLRIVFHDVTSSSGEALWDDFRFGFSDCLDYSDAPASFGDALHKIGRGSGLFLGGANDAEGESIASMDASREGAEDDGVAAFPGLSTGMTRYPLDVTVTNTTGLGAILHGWIDMDGNGSFGAGEYSSVAVPDGFSGAAVTLVWPRLSGLVAGSTFARLRLTTDVLGSSGTTGTAGNGEVEDYLLTISNSYAVSGRVFRDANVDMINDAGEAGLSRLPMVLYDTVNGTCISTDTNAGGEYRFTNLLPGNYRVYEASGAAVPVPENCGTGFARDPAGYLSTTASVSAAFDLSSADVSGIDFGDINRPGFELDNSQTVLPGTLVVSPHRFTTPADGEVVFTIIAEDSTPAGLAWGLQLLFDNNCDGRLDGGDTVIGTGAVALSAGDRLCLLSKVLAPGNASSGAQYLLTLQSRFRYGDGTTALPDDLQQHTDLIRVTASPVSGTGVLDLQKSVWNVTRNMAGDVALPGEVLRYTIRYENAGDGNVDELVIHDRVPAFTQLIPGSLSCSDHPPEVPLCAGSAAVDGTLEWGWATGDKLYPGSGGTVSFEVVVE